MNLLWADDDSEEVLEPLTDFLVKGGFRPIKALNYLAAMEKITEKIEGGDYQALLLDTILPHAEDYDTLASYRGLTLARHAAERGIPTIVFLTVVRRDEVIDAYQELKRLFVDIKFGYYDKTALLEPNQIKSLITFLGGTYE